MKTEEGSSGIGLSGSVTSPERSHPPLDRGLFFGTEGQDRERDHRQGNASQSVRLSSLPRLEHVSDRLSERFPLIRQCPLRLAVGNLSRLFRISLGQAFALSFLGSFPFNPDSLPLQLCIYVQRKSRPKPTPYRLSGSPLSTACRGLEVRAFAYRQAFADGAVDWLEFDIPFQVSLATPPRRYRDATRPPASPDGRTCLVPRPSRRSAAIPECRRCRSDRPARRPGQPTPASVAR